MNKSIATKLSKKAVVKIPLDSFRCISKYPKEKKIICEIDMKDIKRMNRAETIDEIINNARLDYALGDFTTHQSANSLIKELHS